MQLRTYWLSVLVFLSAVSVNVTAFSEQKFKLIHVEDLVAEMKKGVEVHIFDANGETTRHDAGIIPGARLLSSPSKFDVKKELPSEKGANLVFYCANTRCTASHTAAEKAANAGYKNVSVMSDGIYGWKKQGQPSVSLESKGSKPREVEPKVVAQLATLNYAKIVDVRETEERQHVIPGAESFPMSESENPKKWQAFVKSLPKNKLIVFHCASGRRAKSAASRLRSEGFETGYFEGPDQWKSAGLNLGVGP